MRIKGAGRIRQMTRYLHRKFTRGVAILLYHRVATLSTDPYELSVSPQHFREHLQVIRKYAHPLRLQQLVQAIESGDVPPRAVVLTFDDGYADNLYNVKPLLEKYDIPTTVFITTGPVGSEREFWWDELERLLLQPGTLPSTLCLSLNGDILQWELKAATSYSEDEYWSYRGWHVGQKGEPTLRQRLFRSLYQLLYTLSEEKRRHLLDQLVTWSGTESITRATHCTLSRDEVVDLVKDGLVEVGAHTVTHPALASLPLKAQQDEIRWSKAHLEEILDRPVTSFSYPHGSYAAETIAIARKVGFGCACSSNIGTIRRDTDCFQLPRLLVGDWDGETFARWLRSWLGN